MDNGRELRGYLAARPGLLTIQEAMQRLKISRATLYRWARVGRLKTYKLEPRTSRIRREDIEKLERMKPRISIRECDSHFASCRLFRPSSSCPAIKTISFRFFTSS